MTPSNLNLVGKLRFSQTFLIGEFARAQLRPIYSELYGRHYAAKLSPRETALKCRTAVMAEPKPRIARGLNSRPDFILSKDAATSAPLISRVLFKPRSTRVLQLTGRVPIGLAQPLPPPKQDFRLGTACPASFCAGKPKALGQLDVYLLPQ